ncbi:MAG: hypothetical protein ACP5E3_14755, partial [Bacteroidales bacterium]
MNLRKLLLLNCALILFANLYSQDYNWWNELHNWDGISSWKHYITYSSKYMGANALPVPEVNKGAFPDFTEIKLGVQQHSGKGDKTINFLTDFFYPVVPERAGIKLHYVPVEFYQTDTATRDMRAARDLVPEGHSFGDIYISTFIQLIRDHEKLPDLMISINLKTASGTNLGNARHTDAPAYYFDASLGKTFQTGGKVITSWRPYFMGGFYSYQTNRSDFLQNDAFLFGLGFQLETPLFVMENNLGGYLGYFGNGDQPVVLRTKILSRRDAILNYSVSYQFGIHDVIYNTVS